MFKVSLQRFFRKLWKPKPEQAEPEPAQDLQARLQHLSELYPESETCVEAMHVKMHDVDLSEPDSLSDYERLLSRERKALNHWSASKRNKSGAGEHNTARKSAFEIDPGGAAIRASDAVLRSQALSNSANNTQYAKDSHYLDRQPAPSISDAALREMTRLELINRAQISRSLSGFHDEVQPRDTVLADKWDCSEYNSLFSLPDESRYGTTTEYEEDFEEDLLPYFTETLLLQEEELVGTQVDQPPELPTKPTSLQEKSVKTGDSKSPTSGVESSTTLSSTSLQPYKNFSENALKLIAQKPETPAPTLKWLASHTNPHIRAAVAKNPSTPGNTITVLAKDHEAGIRHSIAENPLSSMDALNLLVKDRNPLIAWRAQNTVSQIKEGQKAAQKAKEAALTQAQAEPVHQSVKEAKIATTEETIAFLQVIARKTNTPARRLDDLARHADPRIRAAVAENANAPAEILWILSKDADSAVKTKVTDNYNCPIEILEAMKEDEDAYVAYQAHSVLNRILGATFGDNHLRTATWP